MTLTYPIAKSAETALIDPIGDARTQSEAKRLSGQDVSLETEWLKPSPKELETLQSSLNGLVSTGAVQTYEDSNGQPIFAMSYWKVKELPTPKVKRHMQGEGPKKDDHADDLYFRKGRTRKIKNVDPSQLDLFD